MNAICGRFCSHEGVKGLTYQEETYFQKRDRTKLQKLNIKSPTVYLTICHKLFALLKFRSAFSRTYSWFCFTKTKLAWDSDFMTTATTPPFAAYYEVFLYESISRQCSISITSENLTFSGGISTEHWFKMGWRKFGPNYFRINLKYHTKCCRIVTSLSYKKTHKKTSYSQHDNDWC